MPIVYLHLLHDGRAWWQRLLYKVLNMLCPAQTLASGYIRVCGLRCPRDTLQWLRRSSFGVSHCFPQALGCNCIVCCAYSTDPPRLCKVPCCCPKTATVCFSNTTASTACPTQEDSVQLPSAPQVPNPAALLQHHSGVRAFAWTPLADLITVSQGFTTTALSLSVRNT